MERLLTGIALAVAAAVALLLPGIAAYVGYVSLHSILATEAEINGRLLTQLVSSNPELWRTQTPRLEELLRRRPGDRSPERRAVAELQGQLIAEVDDGLQSPALAARAPVYDAGEVVAWLTVQRSLRPLLLQVGWIAAGGLLLASGIYLWWPRTIENGKPRLRIRWAKGGRIRWRDLHAATGILLSVVLICYIVSGLTWSRYWGENWRAFSSTVAPGQEIDAPSTPAKMGDHDRLGRRIAWAAKDDPVYASVPAGTGVPARLPYADIDKLAKDEHMVPGYTIFGPSDGLTEMRQTTARRVAPRTARSRTAVHTAAEASCGIISPLP